MTAEATALGTEPDTWVAVDFGSTYTKVCGVSAEGVLRGHVYTPTTHEDVSLGFEKGLKNLSSQIDLTHGFRLLASSSANGGLRIFVIGLVRDLSLRAAEMAAFGAGGKVVGAVAGRLGSRDLDRCYGCDPDLIVLAGGIDGGDMDVITSNAKALAERGDRGVPVIVAGNAEAADSCAKALAGAGLRHRIVTNLLPDIDVLNVAEANDAIRREFLDTIMLAKGLNKFRDHRSLVGSLLPTPAAVLEGGSLLWGSHGDRSPTLVVDVGGATTDVYSFCAGYPSEPGVILKGLPEPYAKRTVEGDLGVRENAESIASLVGTDEIARLAGQLGGDITQANVSGHLEDIETHGSAYVPDSSEGLAIDAALARVAVQVAVCRHAGERREVSQGRSTVAVQRGKDLTRVERAIGVGGVLAHGPHASFVLRGLTDMLDDTPSRVLVPEEPDFFVDSSYLMFAVGLLAQHDVAAARRLAQQTIVTIPNFNEENRERTA